jgi:asparagine synthase (glutamine-hydrolysing)
MCGVYFSSKLDINNDYLLNLQTHRGPDATENIIVDSKYYIGQNRLSILDLSGGSQPVKSSSGRYILSFNGEVYNYKELASKFLQIQNPPGDTQVLIALFDKYGPSIVKEFIGMFAIILLDRTKDKLFLIRDHFGIKPLYFSLMSDSIAAASEPKVLFQWRKLSGLNLEFRDDLLSDYFHHRTVTGRNTFVKNVFKVVPSEIVEVDLNSLKNISYEIFRPHVEKINFINDFDNVVKMHLRSDVPYGVFLSGGIDSTLVSCSVPKNSNAFTEESASKDLDETVYAKIVADKQELSLNILQISQESISDLFREFAFYNDDPISDPSAIGLFSICKLVRTKGIKVVLAGEGADELFFGYGAYLRYYLIALSKKLLPNFLINLIFKYFMRFDRTVEDYRSISKFMGSAHLSSRSEKKKVILDKDKVDSFYYQFEGDPDTIQNELNKDRLNRLAFDILMRSDRASMANGVEIRTPFLTQSIEFFADNLPLSRKISLFNLTGKLYLKNIVSGHFGRKFAMRKKRGFDMDVNKWIHDLSDEVNQFIIRKSVPGINYDHIQSSEFKNNSALFWAWITLEFWFELHFDGDVNK